MLAKSQPREGRSNTQSVIKQTSKSVAKLSVSPSLARVKPIAEPMIRQPEKLVKAAPRPRSRIRLETMETKKKYRLIIKEPYIE